MSREQRHSGSRFIRNFGIYPIFILCFSVGAIAADISLAWDPSSSANISGYRIYVGNVSGAYNNTITIGNQTSYRVMGLASGIWYFSVTAFDADGSESDLSNEISESIAVPVHDTSGPVISEVSSSAITSAKATIAWVTDEASDSQVEYGTTINYQISTPLSGIMVTSHSRILEGLTENTLYHYHVKSRDAAGNLATSGDFTFKTSPLSGSVPVIGILAISDITAKSAVVSWITGTPSDSELEYWPADGNIEKALLGTFVTRHSLTLSNLKKQTLYYIRAKSADSEGNQAVSAQASFATLKDGASVVILPRFAGGQDVIGSVEENMIGIALTNISADPASLTFAAIDVAGNLITGKDIVNPGLRRLNAGAQSSMLDFEVFGDGLERSDSKGWIKLESTTSNTSGFFLSFDTKLSFMDGTNFSDTPLTDFIFTEIETMGSSKIDVANNNPDDATVAFDLVMADGTIRSSLSRLIPRNGALVADLYDDLFVGIEPEATDYVRMSSTERVHSFELMKKELGDIAFLTGQDITAGETTLYSPQYVIGGRWQTALTIINLDSRVGMVQFQFLGEDGIQIGPTRILEIPADGKLYIDDPLFFYQMDLKEKIISGYIKIMSDGVRLAGSTVFADSNAQSFSSALPLVDKLHNSVLFSHVASNDQYFTGIAIVNPTDIDAYPVIELHAANGTLIEAKTEHIPAGQKMSGLLTQLFNSLQGKDQSSGYIKITSENPLASFALFGTNNLSVLSAIPPQVIQ